MSCIKLRQNQYTFDASAGTVTILNMVLEPQQVVGIYRIKPDAGATNQERVALFQGLDPKGATITDDGTDTTVTLEFDTTDFDDADELRVDLSFNDTFISEVNSTESLLGASGVFTGEFEYAEPYNTIRIGIKGSIPTDGTVFFDISDDGVTLLRSVPRSVSDASFTLPRILSFNDKYIRIRYVNGTTPQTGTFSIVTKYSTDGTLGLNNVMGEVITGETEGQIVKSVITGNVNDASLVPTNIYENVELMPNKGIKAGLPNTVIIDYSIPPASSLPSGAVPTVHPVLNTESNVYDTGWYPVLGYPSGQLLNFIANQNTQIFLLNASDELGSNIVGNDAPFLLPEADRGTPFAAPYFDAYSRIVVVNNSGSAITSLRLLAKGRQVETPPIYTALDQPIFDQFPAPLTQTVIKGKDDVTSIYEAPNTHQGTNGYTSLGVFQGHRISEVFGREHVDATGTVTGLIVAASTTIYTVPVGKRLHVTSISISVTNLLSTGGVATISDGASPAGDKFSVIVAPGTNQTKQGVNQAFPLPEPLPFDTDVRINIPAIGIGASGALNIVGYIEDL